MDYRPMYLRSDLEYRVMYLPREHELRILEGVPPSLAKKPKLAVCSMIAAGSLAACLSAVASHGVEVCLGGSPHMPGGLRFGVPGYANYLKYLAAKTR